MDMAAPVKPVTALLVALLVLVGGLSAVGAKVDARPTVTRTRIEPMVACVDGGSMPASVTAAYDRHVCAYGV